MVMEHCGIDRWGLSLEWGDVLDYRFLASIAAIQNSNLFTDIIFYWHHVKQVLFL